jgi:voltage-gated potassium channel
LSTVGYGDYYPVSILEKIVGSLIMFCGVTFFSLLMEEFKGIILSWKGDYIDDNERNLNKWMLLLRRFNNKG